MDKVLGRLTVFFEEPFWIGVFERISEGKLSVCKVTFGAEPKDYEVYDFILKNLRYTAVRSNGIESYELYWILSLIDYYEYSGDAAGTESLLSEATGP